MNCPKGLRNGPCGGTLNGKCEVLPELDCVWTNIEVKKGDTKSKGVHLPPKEALLNTASYVNLINGKDRETRLPHEFIDTRHIAASSQLAKKMGRGEFVVTLEIASPLTEKGLSRVEKIMQRTRDHVDAVNTTTNAGGVPSLHSTETGKVVMAHGVESIIQFCGRDQGKEQFLEEVEQAMDMGYKNFLLLTGEWHRFQPDIDTGWDEHWVEFDGEQARRIMSNPAFSPKQPVHSIGADEPILALFIEISEATQTQPPGFEQIIATQASQIVARLLVRLQYSSPAARDMESRIRRACLHILQNAEQMIDTPQLSRDLGISHSAFRNHFKQITGLPPGQYQIHIRLNKARRLLRNSTLSIQEIAEQLGFESIYYFSRLFKKKTGCSPLAYRKQT